MTATDDVLAILTVSVDGYYAGPGDGPGRGLGEGGERLHHWVFGGPWTYESGARGEQLPEDREWFERTTAEIGAVVAGRWTYEAAEHWGDRNPWGVPVFVVTHRPGEQPPGDDFVFVDGVSEAVRRAREAAGGRAVHVMGGGDVIRQTLEAGLARRLTLIVAPVILGGGKRLFDGFTQSIDLEQAGARQSGLATFIEYRIPG